MPDSFDNWNPDDQFWDEAWADMNRRLDHSPKPWWSRWLPLFLILVAGGVGALFLGINETAPGDDLQKASTPLVEQQDISKLNPASPTNGEESGVSRSESASTTLIRGYRELNYQSGSESERTALVAEPNGQSPSGNSSDDFRAIIAEPQVVSPDVMEMPNAISDDQAAAARALVNSGPEFTGFGEQQVHSHPLLLRSRPAPIVFEIQKLILPSWTTLPTNQQDAVIPEGEVIAEKNKPAPFNTLSLLATHGTARPGIGYGLAYSRRTAINNRWAFSAEVSTRLEQMPLRLGAGSSESDIQGVPTADRVSSDQLQLELSQRDLDFVRFITLGLETRAHRNLDENWSLSLGVGLNYWMAGKGPEAIIPTAATTMNLEDVEFSNNDVSEGLGTLSSVINGGGSIPRNVNVNSWQIELAGGVEHVLSERWRLGIDLRYRATEVFNTGTFRLSRFRGQLRLGLDF